MEELLHAHDNAMSFLHAGAAPTGDAPSGTPASREGTPDESEPGMRIGPYTISRTLGEGGFGVVCLAQQAEPVRRTVALKLIKLGMDTRQVIRRFEMERQTLAVMEHPGIARVFDAGTTPAGRPYFVMEYVDGPPITDFCDRHTLGIRDRLALIVRVCEAVQHAHQKGVIHRDIKPSNVLVRMVDGSPDPKVIDFGISKAIEDDATHTVMTHARQIIGTPQYMAPEQAAVDGSRVDTRSDVYSLGVLIYELLAGMPPFEAERLRGIPYAELERILREEEPPRPSTRIAELGDAAERVAAGRRTDAHHLWRSLRGDLDWIVMRALAKDPAARYPTANALAEDIRRAMRGDAVEAGPPSATYRVSKFIRRHRMELAATCIVMLALVALGIGGVWFGVRQASTNRALQKQLTRSEALTAFAKSIITGIDPATARGADTTLLRRVLEGAAGRVETELEDDPEAMVLMLGHIGNAHLSIGDYEQAERIFRRAAGVGTDRLPPDHDLTLQARSNIAVALTGQTRWDDAYEVLTPVVTARRETWGDDHEHTLDVLSNFGVIQMRSGRLRDAVPTLHHVLEHRLAMFGPEHEDSQLVMNNLATAYSRLADYEAAARMHERVLKVQLETLGEQHPRTLATMNNLAGAYADLDDTEHALEMHERVLTVKREILEPDHPSILISIANIASVKTDLGDTGGAEAMLRPAVLTAKETLGETHMHVLGLLNELGRALRAQERYEEADAILVEVIAIANEHFTPEHPNTIIITGNRADLLNKMERYDEAEAVASAVVPNAVRIMGPAHPKTISVRKTYATALAGLHRFEEAETELRNLYDRCAAEHGDTDGLTLRVSEQLAGLYDAWGRPDEAAAWRAPGDHADR